MNEQIAIAGSDDRRETVAPCRGGDVESNVVSLRGKIHLTIKGNVTLCGLGVRSLVNVYSVSNSCKKCRGKRLEKGYAVSGSLGK